MTADDIDPYYLEAIWRMQWKESPLNDGYKTNGSPVYTCICLAFMVRTSGNAIESSAGVKAVTVYPVSHEVTRSTISVWSSSFAIRNTFPFESDLPTLLNLTLILMLLW